jgi:hypothetical protein
MNGEPKKVNLEAMTGRRRVIKTLLMQNMTSAHIFSELHGTL